jgi:hypothetical protein
MDVNVGLLNDHTLSEIFILDRWEPGTTFSLSLLED